mmetsp:Transcript_13049/g.19873  ORF Transcript_13049/g.19873 Transcript_13049/m.19873 type:complete len:523 (-) Transcript_13049:32-1600(-)
MTNNTKPQAGPRARHNKHQHAQHVHQRLPVTVDAPSPTKSKERKAKSSLLKEAWVQLQTVYGTGNNNKNTNNLMIFLGVFVLCSIILLHPTNNNDFHDIAVQNTNNIPNQNKLQNAGDSVIKHDDSSSSLGVNVPTRRPMMVKLRDDIAMHAGTKTTTSNAKHNDNNVIRVDMNEDKWKTFRQVDRSKDQMYALDKFVSSRDWRHRQSDTFIEGDCIQSRDWQLTTLPSCNTIHEVPMADFENPSQVALLSNGWWRDVWRFKEYDGTRMVLKTMRYMHEWEERNYDRHRRDALAAERLTSSEMTVNIFSYCGNSGLFEYSDGGDITRWIYHRDKDKPYSSKEALAVATQVAQGIAAAHSVDSKEYATIAHTDITSNQFIKIDGVFKLNDFNRCRFIRWNKEKNEPCPYTVGNNPGKLRAPEEYAYAPQTEKVDVYSMGNIFYELLMKQWPFENLAEEEAQAKIQRGERGHVSSSIVASTDPATQALYEAMLRSWTHLAKDRPKAAEIAQLLEDALAKLPIEQ